MNGTVENSADATLTAEYWDDSIRVVDADGGVWYPGDAALARMQEAEDPLAAAMEICFADPGEGVWKC